MASRCLGIAELICDHVAAVAERVRIGEVAVAEPWLLRPLWRFEDESGVTVVRAAVPALPHWILLVWILDL